jgi:LCP family protein required for cell wall assembly
VSDWQPPNGGPQGPQPPYEPLPPDLDPRGRRAAHARLRPSATPSAAAGSRSGRRDIARGALLGTKIIAALLSLTVVIGSYWVWSTWNHFSSSIATGAKIVPLETTGANGSTVSKAKDIDGPDQNILILGNDSRAGATPAELRALGTGDDGGSDNTDTMMLMHVPGNGKDATIISFPRDSWVSIPGHGMAKLNAAYPDGYNVAKGQGASETAAEAAGVQLLGQTLQQLTGLTIDHYIQINLLGFYRISNAIAGVPVVLCQAQKDSYSGINLPAGLSTISGTQALAFVRQRHGLPASDLDRIKRQQYFMKSAFHKLTTSGTLLNPFSVQKLLNAVGSSLLTDGVNLLSLADTFSEMAEGNITFQTIPIDNADGFVGNQSVVLITPSKVQTFVQGLVGQSTASAVSSATTVAPGSFSVTVVNASDQNGVATQNAAQLITAGFKATASQSSPGAIPTTTIEYPAGMQNQAKTLLTQIPGATVVQSAQVKVVTLELGTDGLQVTGLGGTTPSAGAGAGSTSSSAASSVTIGTGVPGVKNQPGCID